MLKGTSHVSLQDSVSVSESLTVLESFYYNNDFKNLTNPDEISIVRFQLQLYPKLTENSQDPNEASVIIIFEVNKDSPSTSLKLSYEDFDKVGFDEQKTIKKRVNRFLDAKLVDSFVRNNFIEFIMGVTSEIEDSLYQIKHGIEYYTSHSSHSILSRTNTAEFDFLDSSSCSNIKLETNNNQSRLISDQHRIVKKLVTRPIYCKYLVVNNQNQLAFLYQITVRLEAESSISNKEGKSMNEGEFRQSIQRIKDNQFRVIKNLSHENLCLYTEFNYQVSHNIVKLEWIQQYIEGTCLRDMINESFEYRLLSLQSIPFQLHHILLGLNELHECHLYHGNLDLTTVYIDQKGCAVLMDYFMLAYVLAHLISVSSLFVESDIQEIENLKKTIFPRLFHTQLEDIRSFGIIAYQLFYYTRQLPAINEISLSLASCPDMYVRLIKKCLHARPDKLSSANSIIKIYFETRNIPTYLYSLQFSPQADLTSVKHTSRSRLESDDFNTGRIYESEEVRTRTISDHCTGISRLTHDFKDLGQIAKGGFGRVIKALHKIDQQLYAVKIIKLPPHDKLKNFLRAYRQEVTLLSHLEHENVVRYYHSWIDFDNSLLNGEGGSGSETSSQSHSKDNYEASDSIRQPNKSIFNDEIPQLLKSASNSSSTAVSFRHDTGEDHYSSMYAASSNRIFLERRSSIIGGELMIDDDADINMNTNNNNGKVINKKFEPVEYSDEEIEIETDSDNNVLCIQMEYCEMLSLSQLIDGNLYEKPDEVLLLFREMLEGLNYIHSKNLIHRDLKPANIFIDSDKHIKIGDFGLAMTVENLSSNSNNNQNKGAGANCVAGTLLYLAPELKKGRVSRVMYTQKVDIYSMGLILFEMNYPPFKTTSEKVRIFSEIKDHNYPKDFYFKNSQDLQRQLIDKSLNLDPLQRPTASDMITLLPPKLADESFQEVLTKVLEKPDSPRFKNLLETLFSHKSHLELDKSKGYNAMRMDYNPEYIRMKHIIFDKVYKVMMSHGAMLIDLPSFYPRGLIRRQIPEAVNMLTEKGKMLSVPFDLHIPFADFIAKNKITSNLKTFCIGKVYTQLRPDSTSTFNANALLPVEGYELIFDIITSPNNKNQLAEAEVLSATAEILSNFKSMKDDMYDLYLNHSKLLESILIQLELANEKKIEILHFLFKHGPNSSPNIRRKNLSKSQGKLNELCNLYKSKSHIINALFKEYSSKNFRQELIEDIPSIFSNQNFGTSCHELEILIEHLNIMGFNNKMHIRISPSVINYLNTEGMMFQITTESTALTNSNNYNQSSNLIENTVVATGLQYQSLIAKFSTDRRYNKHVVGVRMDLNYCLSRELKISSSQGNCDCLIVPLDREQSTLTECLTAANNLWTANNIKCELMKSIGKEDDVIQYGLTEGIPIIALFESNNSTNRERNKKRLMLKLLDVKENSYSQKKILVDELLEEVSNFMNKYSKSSANSSNSNLTVRCQDRIKIHIVSNKKSVRGVEEQTLEKLKLVLNKFSNFSVINVIASDLDSKTLLAFIYDLKCNNELSKMISISNEKQKKTIITDMKNLIDCFTKHSIENSLELLIFYSLPEDQYHIVDHY